MDYNYHTHTFRCGHAFGTEREYIEQAISHGIKVLGFTDHILFENGTPEQKALFDDYIKTINELKEEYKDRIEIHLGFECEYIKERIPYYKHLLKDGIVEYLILGQHYVEYKGKKDCWISHFVELGKPEYFSKIYYKHLKAAVKSGLFTYIAHPDFYILGFESPNERFLKVARKICKLAKRHNIPLEINLNGIKNYHNHPNRPTWYPNDEFFKVVSEVGNDVIIGIDAHEVDFFDKADYAYAYHLIEKHNLHEITRLNFKKHC